MDAVQLLLPIKAQNYGLRLTIDDIEHATDEPIIDGMPADVWLELMIND